LQYTINISKRNYHGIQKNNFMKFNLNNLISALIQSFLICSFVFLIEFVVSFFIKDFLQSPEVFALIFAILTSWIYFTTKKDSLN
jgi:membrane protein DedA with SNARE-associated domain